MVFDLQDLKSCSRKRSAGSIPALSTYKWIDTKPWRENIEALLFFERIRPADFGKIYHPQNEYIFIATATFTQNSCSRVLLFSRARFL